MMNEHKWILLAEDTPLEPDLATRVLSDDPFPCEVRVVKDGLEALDCLNCRGEFAARSDGHPALVLLDLKMPKVSGLEVLRQMKANAQLRSIPVVMFTSSSTENDIARSSQLGADAYVVKPVDFKQYTKVL